MAIQYKIDVLAKLKAMGFSTYRIRQEKLLHEATLQSLREGKMVSWKVLDTICSLLKCQPGDLIEYIE